MPISKRYAMIVFDAGGTLIGADWKRVTQDLSRLAAGRQLTVTPEAIHDGFGQVWRDVIDGTIPDRADSQEAVTGFWHQILSTALQRAAAACGLPDGQSLALQTLSIAQEFYPLFDDGDYHLLLTSAELVLDRLSAAGYRLALISNWSPTLPAVLHRLNIHHHFEFVLVSSLVGLAKPDPAIFALGASMAGCAPDELLYVGDSPASDIAGSRAAGWDSVLIARRDPGRHGDIHAPLQITELDDLIGLLIENE